MGFIHTVNTEKLLPASLPLMNKNNTVFQQTFIVKSPGGKRESTYSELPMGKGGAEELSHSSLRARSQCKSYGIFIHKMQ